MIELYNDTDRFAKKTEILVVITKDVKRRLLVVQ